MTVQPSLDFTREGFFIDYSESFEYIKYINIDKMRHQKNYGRILIDHGSKETYLRYHDDLDYMKQVFDDLISRWKSYNKMENTDNTQISKLVHRFDKFFDEVEFVPGAGNEYKRAKERFDTN